MRRSRTKVCLPKTVKENMVNKNTSSTEGDAFASLGVNARTALIILHVTALPLGMCFESFLILRLLKKARKRLWDTLTLALEALLNIIFPVASKCISLFFMLF